MICTEDLCRCMTEPCPAQARPMTQDREELKRLIGRLKDPDFAGPMQHLRDWKEIDRLHEAAAQAITSLLSDLEAMQEENRRLRDLVHGSATAIDRFAIDFIMAHDASPEDSCIRLAAFRSAVRDLCAAGVEARQALSKEPEA